MRLILLLLAISVLPVELSAFQVKVNRDSIPGDSLTLNFKVVPEDHLSEAYSKHINDSTLLQFSSGISIINALRGQVPNLVALPNAYNARGNVRLGNTSIVLDGIPFYNSLDRLLPLNTFDYRSVSVFSNPNVFTAMDGITDGAIFLESKTGQGHVKPMLELNSYTTYGKYDYDQLDPIWYFANSVAYAQDFGKVNTRISYTLNSSNNEYKFRNPPSHTLNTNTIFKVTPKFTTQLITNVNTRSQRPHEVTSVIPYTTKYDQNFLNASLLLRYQFTNWLYVASSTNILFDNYYRKSESRSAVAEENNESMRQTLNLFLNYAQTFGKINAKMYAGLLGTRQQYNASLTRSDFLSGTYEADANAYSYLAGSTITFDQLVSLNGNLRVTEYSTLPDDQNLKRNYSVGFAFLPSRLIKWSPLSLTKIRATYGVRWPIMIWKYPETPSAQNSFLNGRQRRYFETGIELNFLNNRLNFTANYFSNASIDQPAKTSGATGFEVIFINSGDLTDMGTELVFSGVPIITNELKYQVSVLWSNCKIEANSNSGNTGLGISLPNPFPDWRTSFYNSLTWKNLSFNVLVDANKGGTYYTSINNMPYLVDGSFIKLRDVSVGYWIPLSATNKLGLSKLWLSTSFRNPVIYLPNDFDSETYIPISSEPQKTISFNVYAAF